MERPPVSTNRAYQCPSCLGQFMLNVSFTGRDVLCPHCQENVPFSELTPIDAPKTRAAAMDLEDFLAQPPLPSTEHQPSSTQTPDVGTTPSKPQPSATTEPFEIPSFDQIVFREPVEQLGGLIDDSQLTSQQRWSVHLWRNIFTASVCILILVGVMLLINRLRG